MQQKPPARGMREFPKAVLILTPLAIVAAVVVSALWYYSLDSKTLKDHKYNELKSIASLKADQIIKWRNDRLTDARMLSAALTSQSAGAAMSDEYVNRLFTAIQTTDDYSNIMIVGRSGLVERAELSPVDKPEGISLVALRQCFESGNPVATDLYRCRTCGLIHMDVFSPIPDRYDNVARAACLRIAPDRFLFTLIQTWPTPSASAETLLVRRDGDQVLYLNELRFRKDTALKLRLPLTDAALPATQAALGESGIFEGYDYRGIHVLADIRRIPDTTWFMVAKIDFDEIFADLNARTGFAVIVSILLAVLSGLGTILWFNLRQRELFKRLYLAELAQRQAEEEFRATLYSIGDAVMTTDMDANVRHMNQVAESLTGWDEALAKGRPVREIFRIVNEESREPVIDPVSLVLKHGKVVDLANHTILLARDGSELPIADSGAPIRNQEGDVVGVVLVFRDQTKERNAARILHDSILEKEALLRELHHRTKNNMQVISSMLGLQTQRPGGSDVETVVAETRSRINTMALVHQKLYNSRSLSHIDLKEYLTDLIAMILSTFSATCVKINPVVIMEPQNTSIDVAIPCGLILNELITNTCKHAFPVGDSGELTIGLVNLPNGFVQLTYSDSGAGWPAAAIADPAGMGIALIRTIAEHQLQGTVEFGTGPGFSCSIKFKPVLYLERI